MVGVGPPVRHSTLLTCFPVCTGISCSHQGLGGGQGPAAECAGRVQQRLQLSIQRVGERHSGTQEGKVSSQRSPCRPDSQHSCCVPETCWDFPASLAQPSFAQPGTTKCWLRCKVHTYQHSTCPVDHSTQTLAHASAVSVQRKHGHLSQSNHIPEKLQQAVTSIDSSLRWLIDSDIDAW